MFINSHVKTVIGILLGIITVCSLVMENETVFPTALVVSMVYLIGIRKPVQPADGNDIHVKSALRAIICFSLVIAALSLCVSITLPAIAEMYNLTGLFDGDFVRVTINDVHEFAYMTFFLLIIESMFYLYYQRIASRKADKKIPVKSNIFSG